MTIPPDTKEIMPEGVQLRDPEDFSTARKSIFDGMHQAVSKSFPQTYGGVRMEMHDLKYEDPEEYDITQQKSALMNNQQLSRRLRGTLRLFDAKDNTPLDEKRITVARVPYLTERGTYINEGSEYSSMSQFRLMPGIYHRRKDNGEQESHFNIARGTGPGFRIGFEPKSALYRLNIGQAQLRLYSLLHDMGVPDEQMKKSWGAEVFQKNKSAYDPRTLDKAYTKIVRKADPAATREQKVAALHEAFNSMKVSRWVAERTLPGMFSEKRASNMLPLVHFTVPPAAHAPLFSMPESLKAVNAPAKPSPFAPPVLQKVAQPWAPNDSIRQMITSHEGMRTKPYLDTKNHETVGVGFNLNRPGAADAISRVGANFHQVMAGKQQLSPAQIGQLLDTDITSAHTSAGRFLPGLDTYPEPVQNVLTDMAFNLGPSGLSAFHKFRQALINKDYPSAAAEMQNSKWWGEVGNRGPQLRDMLLSSMQKSSSAVEPWVGGLMVKLARVGALVMLPTSDGKYLLQRNDPDHHTSPGKLRPPGGGSEPTDSSAIDTITREMKEEFGVDPSEVKSRLKLIGYETRPRYRGTAIFHLTNHGLSPGEYQASNDPEEIVRLEEASLDDPDYSGPVLSRLRKP